MKNKVFFVFMVLIMLLFVSCATKVPNESFLPSSSESLLIGRIEYVIDGKPVKPKTESFLETMKVGIHPYPKIKQVVYNPIGIKAAKYNVEIKREDGFFFISVPASEYYFERLLNSGHFKGKLIRTYYQENNCNSQHIPSDDHCLLKFSVKPKSVTYVGTIRINITTDEPYLCVIYDGFKKPVEQLREREWIASWEVVNEQESALEMTKNMYPNIKNISVDLIEKIPYRAGMYK